MKYLSRRNLFLPLFLQSYLIFSCNQQPHHNDDKLGSSEDNQTLVMTSGSTLDKDSSLSLFETHQENSTLRFYASSTKARELFWKLNSLEAPFEYSLLKGEAVNADNGKASQLESLLLVASPLKSSPKKSPRDVEHEQKSDAIEGVDSTPAVPRHLLTSPRVGDSETLWKISRSQRRLAKSERMAAMRHSSLQDDEKLRKTPIFEASFIEGSLEKATANIALTRLGQIRIGVDHEKIVADFDRREISRESPSYYRAGWHPDGTFSIDYVFRGKTDALHGAVAL